MVFVASGDSPAVPFWFLLSPIDGVYRLYGEGTGNKRATDAAYADLKRLDADAIADLISQATQMGPKR